MSKERIIDGVDVTECKDYREVEYKEMPVCMNYYNNLPKPPKETEWQYCAGNKYCYYKQLRRLQTENEKLKKEIKSYKCQEKFPNQCHCAFRCLGNEFCQDADKRIEKYRKAFEEIKEYIQSLNKDICNNCGWHNTVGCRPNSYVCHDLIEIQNKISEVLE